MCTFPTPPYTAERRQTGRVPLNSPLSEPSGGNNSSWKFCLSLISQQGGGAKVVQVTVVFTDEGKGRENESWEGKEEKRHLPLIYSVIITAVISCGHEERNKTIPSLRFLFSSRKCQRQYPWRRVGDRERERLTARQTAKRGGDRKKNREREDERLVFSNPRWFVMLEVRHISLGLPGALQECELLQQQSASSTSPPH